MTFLWLADILESIKAYLFELHIREGVKRHLVYFIIHRSNCFSIIKSVLIEYCIHKMNLMVYHELSPLILSFFFYSFVSFSSSDETQKEWQKWYLFEFLYNYKLSYLLWNLFQNFSLFKKCKRGLDIRWYIKIKG